MGKHAKPSRITGWSQRGARAATAVVMTSVGLVAAGPAASAGVAGHDGDVADGAGDVGYRWSNDAVDAHRSQGLVNVSDNTVQVPVQVCHNAVAVDALGVQVPAPDVSGNAAVGTDGDGEVSASRDSCGQTSHQPD